MSQYLHIKLVPLHGVTITTFDVTGHSVLSGRESKLSDPVDEVFL